MGHGHGPGGVAEEGAEGEGVSFRCPGVRGKGKMERGLLPDVGGLLLV